MKVLSLKTLTFYRVKHPQNTSGRDTGSSSSFFFDFAIDMEFVNQYTRGLCGISVLIHYGRVLNPHCIKIHLRNL